MISGQGGRCRDPSERIMDRCCSTDDDIIPSVEPIETRPRTIAAR